jgi:hypothetical protein
MGYFRIRSLFLSVILLLGMIGAGACTPQTPEPIPTIARFPTDTPTFTASAVPTRTPTFTKTITPTRTPTPTHTLTPSKTFTPTRTPTITLTPSFTKPPTLTPSRTYTPSKTFTPSPTYTPTNTRPPTLTPSPTVLPFVIFFTADTPSLLTNSATTLRWQTQNAETVTLERVAGGRVAETYSVPASGERLVTMSSAFGASMTWRLTARRGRFSSSREVSIQAVCNVPYFFVPAPPECPLEPPARSALLFQQFERGLAFYVPTTRNIYILALAPQDNSRVNAYPLDWDYSPLPVLTPPAGLLQPFGEIGYIFSRKQWSDGRSLVEVIGWATAPQQGYDGATQRATASDLYIRRPDGAVYKLALAGVGRWSVAGTAQ